MTDCPRAAIVCTVQPIRVTGSGRHIQLRLEAFNVLNTVTPGNPQTTISSSDFGRVTSLAAGTAPRIMQLAVKYEF